jgi:hypothetical protein
MLRNFVVGLTVLFLGAFVGLASAASHGGKTVMVGGETQKWSIMAKAELEKGLNLTVGDKLQFQYGNMHDVFLLPSKAAFDSCDFAAEGAKELADNTKGDDSHRRRAEHDGHDHDHSAHTGGYEYTLADPGTLYFACSYAPRMSGSHCKAGQKIAVAVAAKASSDGAHTHDDGHEHGQSATPPSTTPPSSKDDGHDHGHADAGVKIGGMSCVSLLVAAMVVAMACLIA